MECLQTPKIHAEALSQRDCAWRQGLWKVRVDPELGGLRPHKRRENRLALSVQPAGTAGRQPPRERLSPGDKPTGPLAVDFPDSRQRERSFGLSLLVRVALRGSRTTGANITQHLQILLKRLRRSLGGLSLRSRLTTHFCSSYLTRGVKGHDHNING